MRHSRERVVALTLLLGMSTACSSETLVSQAKPGTSSGAGGSSGASSGGGSGGSAGGGAGGTDPGNREGFIGVESSSAPDTYSSALAWFEGQESPLPCTTVYEDPHCRVIDCADEDWVQIDAGTITVVGDLRTSVLDWDGAEYPIDYSSTAGLYTPGSEISVDVAGSSEISPFAHTLVAPSPVQITQPSLVAPLTIDRSVDLAIEWTGTSTGQLHVVIAGATALRCDFPLESGTATIATAALAELAGTDGYINFFVREQEVVALTDMDVRVASSTRALSGDTTDGYAMLGNVVLE